MAPKTTRRRALTNENWRRLINSPEPNGGRVLDVVEGRLTLVELAADSRSDR